MSLKAINGYTDWDSVVLIYRDEYGKQIKRIPKPDWYFYADGSLYDILKSDPSFCESFKECCGISKIVTERPYLQIHTSYTKTRKNENGLKDSLANLGVKTYEMDVDPLKRMMLDSEEIEISDTYRCLFMDIETDDRPREGEVSNEIVVGERQIISTAGFENEESNFVFHSWDEVEVLRFFLKRMKDYDVLIGWNSDHFDIPYIKARIEYLRIMKGIDLEKEFNIDWRNFITVDLMWRFKHVYQSNTTLSSFSLAKVSKHFEVGEKVDLGKRLVWNVFAEEPELGKSYNLQDCRLLFLLERKLGIFAQMVAMSRFCRTFLSQFYITELLDNLILKEGKRRRVHLPSRVWRDKDESSFAGGFVLPAKPGLFENINIFDFQSLYPNLIRTFNISPDRLVNDASGPNFITGIREGTYFSKEQLDPEDPDSRLGILPRVAKFLLDRRQELKTVEQKLTEEGKADSLEYKNAHRDEMIVKEACNSLYGICGTPRSRYYSIEMAESITLAGQYMIKYARDFFESLGFVVCAGDTDSIMVSLPTGSDPNSILEKFHIELKNHLIEKYKVDDCFLKMKHEKRFSRFINVAKKNYVGRVVEEGGKPLDKLYAKGLELIKKDTIGYTRDRLNELLKWLLYEDHDIQFYVDWVEKIRNEFHTRDFKVSEICYTKKMSRHFEAYKTRPTHVKLMEKHWNSENKEHFVGMDVVYIITDKPDKENGVILAAEYNGVFDRIYYWEHNAWPPIRRILEPVFSKHDWSVYDKSTIQRPKKKRKRKKKSEVSVDEQSPELVSNGISKDSETGI